MEEEYTKCCSTASLFVCLVVCECIAKDQSAHAIHNFTCCNGNSQQAAAIYTYLSSCCCFCCFLYAMLICSFCSYRKYKCRCLPQSTEQRKKVCTQIQFSLLICCSSRHSTHCSQELAILFFLLRIMLHMSHFQP